MGDGSQQRHLPRTSPDWPAEAPRVPGAKIASGTNQADGWCFWRTFYAEYRTASRICKCLSDFFFAQLHGLAVDAHIAGHAMA